MRPSGEDRMAAVIWRYLPAELFYNLLLSAKKPA